MNILKHKFFEKGQIFFPGLFILLIIVLVGFTSEQIRAQCADLGSTAPDFKLLSLSGDKIELSQFENKQDFIILVFSKDDNSDTMRILLELESYLDACQPRESFKMITVMSEEDEEADDKSLKNNLIRLKNITL